MPPALVARLEAAPVRVLFEFQWRLENEHLKLLRAAPLDVADVAAVVRLELAPVVLPVSLPAPFLPVRKLPTLDGLRRIVGAGGPAREPRGWPR